MAKLISGVGHSVTGRTIHFSSGDMQVAITRKGNTLYLSRGSNPKTSPPRRAFTRLVVEYATARIAKSHMHSLASGKLQAYEVELPKA